MPGEHNAPDGVEVLAVSSENEFTEFLKRTVQKRQDMYVLITTASDNVSHPQLVITSHTHS